MDYTSDETMAIAREIVNRYHAATFWGRKYVGWIRVCCHYASKKYTWAIEIDAHEVAVEGYTRRSCLTKLRRHYRKELKRQKR